MGRGDSEPEASVKTRGNETSEPRSERSELRGETAANLVGAHGAPGIGENHYLDGCAVFAERGCSRRPQRRIAAKPHTYNNSSNAERALK